MNRVAFYISNHGYGHAARCIPIIESILEQNQDLYVFIKTGSNVIDFMGQYASRIGYESMNTDVGLILKPGTMEIDKIALLQGVDQFIGTWERLINNEKEWMTQYKIDLMVSDIVPWVFKSAKPAKVRSVLISNFTWAKIYKELFAERIYEEYLECYQEADLALLYPLAGDIKRYFRETMDVGLSCRNFYEENVSRIKGSNSKPIVYLSVGRSVDLTNEINLEGLSYQFIYTQGIKLKGENTKLLPINIDSTHDYIKAADYVITKAGWGTVAEAICAHKPMLVLRRDEVVEDRVTLHKLIELGIALPITIKELKAECLNELLPKLEVLKGNYKYLSSQYRNSSDQIAEQIICYIERGEVERGNDQ